MEAVVDGLDQALREAVDRGDVIIRDSSMKPSAPPRDPSNHS